MDDRKQRTEGGGQIVEDGVIGIRISEIGFLVFGYYLEFEH
jgi:hypothetical protein